MQVFEELSEIFSDHNNYLTSRELLMKVRKASSPSCLSSSTLDVPPLSAMMFLHSCKGSATLPKNS